jgi:uncharacterized protein YkwD
MRRFALVVLVAALGACSGAAELSSADAGDDDSSTGGTGSGAAGGNRAGSGGRAGSASIGGRAGSKASSAGSGGKAGRAGSPSAGRSNAAGEAGDDEAGSGGINSGTGGTSAPGGASGVSTNHTNPLSQDLINAFVKAHNDARSGQLVPAPSPALPPVTWDAVLADSAYNYLSQCESGDGNLVDHNANRTKDYAALGGSDYIGENIYASSASSVSPADAVSSWMGEASKYVPGDITSAGHYTQVVWRDSLRIGCAIVNCPSVRFHNTVLCDYAPGGNISGQLPY